MPGIMKPLELSFLLIVGAIAVLYGLSGLLGSRESSKTAKFESEAAALLKGKGELEAGHVSVEFTDRGMTVTVDGAVESFEADKLEFAVEEDDVFIVGFAGRAVVLQKRDLALGEIAEFARYLAKTVKMHRITTEIE